MRENHLKMIEGGTIISSEACLIINTHILNDDSKKGMLASRFVKIVNDHMSLSSV